MSDLHLGDKYSLLTRISEDGTQADLSAASKTLRALAECVKKISFSQGTKPSLVLIGDALELALARTHEALTAFEIFIKTMLNADGTLPFSEIIFIPGNHDHHMWEATRETRYVENLSKEKADVLVPFNHTSPMFCTAGSSCTDYFLGSLLKSGRIGALKQNLPVLTSYPNFALKNDSRCVIMSHGHYIEPFYRVMSELDKRLFPQKDKPTDIEDLERQNFAWLDFFWSSMGRQGEAGKSVEHIYYSLNNSKELRKLLVNLLKSFVKSDDKISGDFLDSLVFEKALEWLIKKISKRERINNQAQLGKDAVEGLYDYLNQYVASQYNKENGQENNDMVELETSFIFGHTHSPFCLRTPSKSGAFKKSFARFSKPLDLYNTGGWVIEDTEPNLTHGAFLVVIDENLECAAIDMYMEKADGHESPLQVLSAAGQENDLVLYCRKLINEDCFAKFSKDAAFAVADRIDFREKFAEKFK